MRKIIGIAIVLLVLLGLMFWFAIFCYAPFGIVKPHRGYSDLNPEDFGLQYEELNVQTFDSLELKGYWIKSCLEDPKGVMIFLHGVGDIKESSLVAAEALASVGYESIVYDSRAHGESEGYFCTYGYYEKNDVQRIVHKVRSVFPDIKIGLWGRSMGGAVALQSMAQNTTIDFGIIESTFANFRHIVYDYQHRIMGFRMCWLADLALGEAAKIAAFNPDLVKPIAAIKKIDRPLLIIHGDVDPKVPTKYSRQLAAEATSVHQELFIVRGANHDNVWDVGGELYLNTIHHFMKRWAGISN